jgi:muramidase (phage lysozyme)
MNANLKAFLSMIATAEGTAGIGEDGYNVLVGSTKKMPILFGSYHDHPRIRVQLSISLVSTAAGRYQILARNYDAYKNMLKLSDFSPASQDAIALKMIKEQGAYDYIIEGKFDQAVFLMKNIWASLPGAGYGQREVKLADLRTAYTKAGGNLNS